MLRYLRSKKGQNTAEYAIVIGLVIAAAIAMQTYIKRGIQAKIKDGTDLLTGTSGSVAGSTLATSQQYEPYYMSSDFDVARTDTLTESTASGGGVTRTIGDSTTTRTGYQEIGAIEEE